MKITSKIVAEKLKDYLLRRISINELIDWSENMMMEAEFDEEDLELIREILAHLGVADVKEFGLTWDDCYDYLHKLGYDVKVKLQKVV